jgi:O-antigen/teichoic acid export membrane protein
VTSEPHGIAPSEPRRTSANGTVGKFVANVGYGGARGSVLFVNTLVLTPILIFGLGKEQFAILALATPFLRYGFNGVFDFGLATGLVRFVSRDFAAGYGEGVNRYFASALSLYILAGMSLLVLFRLASSAFVGSVLGLDARMHATAATVLWQLLWIYVLLLLSNPFFALLMGVQKVHVSHIVGTVSLLMELVGILALLPIGITLSRVILVYAVGAALSTLLCIYLARRSFPGLNLRLRFISRESISDLAHYTARWSVTVSTSLLAPVIDKLILARFVGLSSVAIYEAASKLVEILKRATQLLLLPVFPMAGAVVPNQTEVQTQKLYRRIFSANLAVNVGLYLIPATLTFEIMRVWLGSELSEPAGWAFLVLSFTGLLLALVAPGALILAGTGRMRLLVTTGLVALSLNIFLNAFLAKRFGFWGLLAGTAFAYCGQSLLILASLQRLRDFALPVGPILRMGLAALASAVLPGVILVRAFSREQGIAKLVVVGVLGVVIYCLVLLAFAENRKLAVSVFEHGKETITTWMIGKGQARCRKPEVSGIG